MKKILRIILYIILITFFGYIFFGKDTFFNNSSVQKCEEFKKLKFEGIVIRSYEDFSNKGIFTAEIKTRDDTVIYSQWNTTNPIWIVLENGDSLVKIENSFNYKIFKNTNIDSLVFIEGINHCDSIY